MLRRALLSCFASAAALALTCAPARADEGWDDDIEVMQDEEMADQRGGFRIGGFEFNFGAVITSTIDGVPVLTTTIMWTDAGAIIQRTLAGLGQNLDDLTPEQRSALGLDGLEGAGGLLVEGTDGVTALVHNVTDGSLQNIIVNTATGRDISQDIDVRLELPNFEFVQQQLMTERFGIRIGDDLNTVSIGLGD
jgi:hypothetical protein